MTIPLIPGQARRTLRISGTPVTTATESRPYMGFTVSATGGKTPYVFSVADGAFPAGIVINPSSGIVSGTPTEAGDFDGITLRVTDARGLTADLAPFDLTVAEPVQIAGTPVTTATEGTPYDGFTVTGSEGTAPLVYSVHSGAFPAGIDIDPDTGEVSGTPTESGDFDAIVLRVTDAYGSTADLPGFDLTVEASAAYTCGAVVFDGATDLQNASFVVADSPLGVISIWFDCDAMAANGNQLTFTTLGGQYWKLQILQQTAGVTNWNFNVWDGATNSKQFGFNFDGPNVSAWGNIILAVDTNHPAGEKIGVAVVDGTPVATNNVQDVDDAFSVGWGVSGEDLSLGSYNPITGYGADWWFGFGQFLDLTNPANVAKFISAGKPVDLGADGSTPTGTAPAIFLHIPAAGTPANFANNLGTGGNFTITGSLSLAPSSPSD